MTINELQQIVTKGESEEVEFKRSTGQLTRAMKTVCAMLNGRGGFLLIGVTDAGAIVGQQVSDQTLQDVVRYLRQIDPFALLSPEVVDLGGDRSVIAIRIPVGSHRPYTFDGRPYMRQGTTTSVMPAEHYQRLVAERVHPTQRWEMQPAHQFGIDDLDHAEITRTVDEAIRRGRMDEPGTRDPEALLLGLGLLTKGVLRNAAVVLFGRSDRLLPYYPECLLRLARFKGVDKSEFVDNKQIHGNAFHLFQQAQRFMREHLPIAGRIEPPLYERVDDPLYPMEALREALANALCHRDYAIVGGSVGVAIFDDRLEVSSTGRLPFGLTTDDLKRPHVSQPWNPLIANIFYRRGIIETWGRGTIKMAELTNKAGLVAPEFEEQAGSVIVRFLPNEYVPSALVGLDVTPLQKELYMIVGQLQPVSLTGIMAALKDESPRRTVQDNLQVLREYGVIELTGRGRSARWSASEK